MRLQTELNKQVSQAGLPRFCGKNSGDMEIKLWNATRIHKCWKLHWEEKMLIDGLSYETDNFFSFFFSAFLF